MRATLRGKIFLFLCLLAGTSFAQTKAVLQGVITDGSDKSAIMGASIYDPADRTHGAMSDIDGRYVLRLSPGKHTIVCAFIGMRSDSITVVLDTLKPKEHNFVLESGSTQLETMVVSAGKYERKLEEITVSMEVLKTSLIENKSAANVTGILEQAPGLNILDGEPQIRGGSGFNFGIGSRVAILIDGLPALAGDGGKPEWNFIPLENVEQIEIIKGASSVTYGSSALSGSINIRTTYPKDKPLTKVSLASGFYDAPPLDSSKWWKGMANFSNISFLHSEKMGQLDLVLGGMAIYDHGFIGPPGYHPNFGAFNDTTIEENEVGEKTGRLNFNLRYRLKNNDKLNFGLNGNFMKSTDNLSLIWDNDSSGLYRAFPHTMTLNDQTMLYVDPFLNYFSRRDFKHSLRSRYFYTENTNTDTTSSRTHVAYNEYQLTKQVNEKLNITGGLIMNQTFSNTGLSFNGIAPKHHMKNFGAFAQLDLKMWKVLNVSLGARGESFSMNNAKPTTRPIFRSGLNWKMAEYSFLRYSYGQGYRYPTITEKYMYSDIGGLAIYPNPDLKAESSWNTEVGFKQGFKIHKFRGYVDLAFFWQEYKNTIEFTFGVWNKYKDMFGDDSLSTGFKYLNTGDTRVKGFEVSVPGEGKLGRNWKMNVLFGYTYVLPQAVHPAEIFATDSTYLGMCYNFTSTDTTNDILKYRFQHIAKIDVQLTYKAFSVGGDVRYYSFVQNIDQVFYIFEPQMQSGIKEYREKNNKGTMVVDLRAGVDITKKFKMALIVNNVLNKSYSLRPLKIESPRTFAIRLAYNFSGKED